MLRNRIRGERLNTQRFKINLKIWLFIIPSLIGMTIFYFAPALVALFYSMTDVHGYFIWFTNFTETLQNVAFQLAARNTFLFIIIGVPLSMVISFILASFSRDLKLKKLFTIIFIIPLIIPSGPMVFFWRSIFAENGLINRILFVNNMDTVSWLSTSWAFVVVLIIYLIKYTGFNYVLFSAGFHLIPKDYYEVAKINGAGVFQTFRHVTFIYLLPTTFLVMIMSIINSFKIFREVYLLFGPYPQTSTYMLQHFMNNQFIAANLQRLSVTAIMLSILVLIVVLGIFKVQKKVSGEIDVNYKPTMPKFKIKTQ